MFPSPPPLVFLPLLFPLLSLLPFRSVSSGWLRIREERRRESEAEAEAEVEERGKKAQESRSVISGRVDTNRLCLPPSLGILTRTSI